MKKKVRQFLEDFQSFFNIQGFERTIGFPDKNKENLLADIDTETKYQRIHLNVYDKFFKDKPEDQRKTLLHELLHTVLHDLEMCAWDLRNDKAVSKSHIEHTVEVTTSKLENMFHELLKDGKKLRAYYKNYLD